MSSPPQVTGRKRCGRRPDLQLAITRPPARPMEAPRHAPRPAALPARTRLSHASSRPPAPCRHHDTLNAPAQLQSAYFTFQLYHFPPTTSDMAFLVQVRQREKPPLAPPPPPSACPHVPRRPTRRALPPPLPPPPLPFACPRLPRRPTRRALSHRSCEWECKQPSPVCAHVCARSRRRAGRRPTARGSRGSTRACRRTTTPCAPRACSRPTTP